MRILHVIPRAGLGGAEKLASDLIDLQRPDHETKLCVLGHPGSFRDIAGLVRCINRLRNEVWLFNPDIIHAHLWPAAMVCSVIAITTGTRLIVHAHDMQPCLSSTKYRERIKCWLNHLLLEAANAHLIAVSEAVKQYTARQLKLRECQIEVVCNGVKISPAGPDISVVRPQFTIGAAGRLVSEKGFDGLIRSVSEMRREGINLHLIIAGEGSQRSPLEKLSRELGLSNDVTFLGRIHDMASFYEKIDAFILPSISSEGMPLTILEAMSMQLPVIASDIAGVREVVRHEKTGLLIPPGDTHRMAEAIATLARHRQLCRHMGACGRARVLARFTRERMTSEISAIYHAVAA